MKVQNLYSFLLLESVINYYCAVVILLLLEI